MARVVPHRVIEHADSYADAFRCRSNLRTADPLDAFVLTIHRGPGAAR